jgi:DNA-3-methyladenine glycosylase II
MASPALHGCVDYGMKRLFPDSDLSVAFSMAGRDAVVMRASSSDRSPALARRPVAWAPHGLLRGTRHLVHRDRDLARIIETAGTPRFPLRPPGFPTLLHIILEQQVSIDAAAAMFRNLQLACVPLAPAGFLTLGEAELRRCGFSRQKIGYARSLAEAIRDGRCDLAALEQLSDEAALAELVKLKGIGRWTAQVYLLFVLGRPDVWPADDLGLQLAIQRLDGLGARPRASELIARAETWRPWRSVAACLLWQFYLHALGRLERSRRPSE